MNLIKLSLFLLLPFIGVSQTDMINGEENTNKQFKIKLLNGEEDSLITNIHFFPLLGYNNTDGIMAGLHLTNNLFLDKKLKWSLSPMYGFDTKEIVGFGDVSYSIFPNKIFNKVEFGLKVKRFSYYHHELYGFNDSYLNVKPFVRLVLNETKRGAQQEIRIRLAQNYLKFGRGISIDSLIYELGYQQSSVGEVEYSYLSEKESGTNEGRATIQVGKNFGKINLLYKTSFAYENKRFVHVRVQGGYLIKDFPNDVNPFFTGTGRMGFFTRPNDYMFDNYFVSRNAARTDMFSQQIFEKDAHIKTLANNIISDSYMLSFGVKADLPIPGVPIQPYIDAVVYPDLFEDGILFDYSLGVAISVLNENVEIYFPIYSSEHIRNNINVINVDYIQKIMFKIDLQDINYHKYMKKVKVLF